MLLLYDTPTKMLTLASAIEQLPALKKSPTAAYQVNLACERLLAMGKFKGMLDTLRLRVYEDGTITLPGDYETLIGAARNGTAQVVHDPWYEFAPRTNATFFPDPRYYPADLGDDHVTYRSPAGADALRLLVADETDAEKEVTVVARRTEDEGIKAGIESFTGTLAEAAEECLSGPIEAITRLLKPRTAGPVSLEARVSGGWVEVGRFGARDTEIRLRKYSLPAAKEDDVVVAYAKRRFRPAEELTDELQVESIYCLRMSLDALSYETEGDLEKASNFWALSRRALSDALSESRSSAVRTVPIYCRAAAGSKLRAIR